MKYAFCFYISILAFSFHGFCGTAELASASNRFAFKIYDEAEKCADKSENTVLAPFSIYQTLGLLYLASGGESSAEIAAAAGFDADRAALADSFGKLLSETLGGEKNVVSANSVWMTSLADANEDFVGTLKNDFNGEFFGADFSRTAKVSDKIVKWIDKNTLGLIAGFSMNLNPDTALIFINASAFDKVWKYKFNKGQTMPMTFMGRGGDVQTPFMHGTLNNVSFIYDPIKKYSAIEIPYAGDKYSMLIIMPEKRAGEYRVGFNEFEEALRVLRERKNPGDLVLNMPRFEINLLKTELKKLLPQMGVKKIFEDENIDFSPLSSNLSERFNGQVYIGNTDSYASIKADEYGTKAASATVAIGFGCSAANVNYAKIDMPFKYFVIHKKTNLILFMGEINGFK